MKNAKIKTKLIFSFGIVLALLLVIGISAFISINNLNSVVYSYKSKSLPSVDSLAKIRRSMISIQRDLLLASVSPDQNVTDESIQQAQSDRQLLNEALESFKQTMQTDPALIQKFESIVVEAANYRKTIEGYAKQNLPETNLKAYEVFINNYKPAVDKAIDILEEIKVAQDNIVDNLDSTAAFNIRTAYIIVALVLVASLIITLMLISRLNKTIAIPIIQVEKAAKEIAIGNLNVNLTQNSKDEIGELVNSFSSVRNSILKLTENINGMAKELENGDIDSKINVDDFQGAYKEVAVSINNSITSLINDTLVILNSFNELGNGNFKVDLNKFPGKKSIANDMFLELKNNLTSLNKDVKSLIDGAINGELNTSVDTSLYKGDWSELTKGLNNLLSAVNKPIDESNKVLAQLAEGNFNVEISSGYRGSFDFMMSSFNKMVTSIGSYINEITEILDAISQGVLNRKIEREYVGQFSLIKNSINKISNTLRSTISDIKISSDNVLVGAKQISETSMDLANGASNQASSVQELNASITAINEQTHQNAEQAKKANDFSKQSIENARNGNDEMVKMLSSMNDIKEASKNISKIIKVIDDIAFQTNLLALNAAVEAARAGKHGVGFSVVAEEVRSLAGRSQQAAKDTSNLIEDIISKINDGTETAKLTASSLEKIVEDTNSVSSIIDEIYMATTLQTEGISQISEGIDQISEVVQRNSSTSEESAAAAEELSSQSEVLSNMVAHFTI